MDKLDSVYGLDARTRMQSQLRAVCGEVSLKLAELLEPYRSRNPLVVAVAPGGRPIADQLAVQLGAELDLIVAQRVGAPPGSVRSLGAVTAAGARALNCEFIEQLGLSETFVERLFADKWSHAQALERDLRRGLPSLDARHRTVILVDDNVHTGATLRACISTLKRSAPTRIVLALQAGGAMARRVCSRAVSEIVCDPALAASVLRIQDAGHYLQEDAHETIVPAMFDLLHRT
jgi:putative phosphoribosyl transferase